MGGTAERSCLESRQRYPLPRTHVGGQGWAPPGGPGGRRSPVCGGCRGAGPGSAPGAVLPSDAPAAPRAPACWGLPAARRGQGPAAHPETGLLLPWPAPSPAPSTWLASAPPLQAPGGPWVRGTPGGMCPRLAEAGRPTAAIPWCPRPGAGNEGLWCVLGNLSTPSRHSC